MSPQGPDFSSHSTAKTNYKSTNIRKLVSSGISDVGFASVYSGENPSEEGDDYNNYYYL